MMKMYTIFSGRSRIIRNRRAIELSINFIVMLIIAIAIFGFGIRFMAQFFSGTQKMKTQLDTQTQARIEALLDQGSRVAIPLNSKDIAIGKNDLFGLGILNVMSAAGEDTFYIAAGCDDSKISLLYSPTHILKNNEKKIIDILAQVEPGARTRETHICNVYVRRGAPIPGCPNPTAPGIDPYFDCDKTQNNLLYGEAVLKFYVKVP